MNIRPLFENEHFVALDKPSGLLSVPDRTQSEPSLKDILIQKYDEIFTVHRLDKYTSGLILFAKNSNAHKLLSGLFESRKIEKYYVGITNGIMEHSSGIIEIPIIEHPAKNGTMTTNAKGKPSITEYKTIEQFKNYSFVDFQIHTGRTHQIRVHAKYMGHSVVCDDLYGDGKGIYISSIKRKFNLSKNELEEKPIMGRLALHSHRINFDFLGEHFALEAPIPKDIHATLQQLRKHNSMS